jgi:basic membrane protein A and related proteins
MSNKHRLHFALIVISLLTMLLLTVGNVAVAQDGYVDACLDPSAMATEEMAAPPAENANISFQIILPNARGDRSFIDSAAAGAERAIAELGVEGTIIETAGVQEHDAAVRRAVQDSPDVVITIAVDSSTIQEIAEEFPDQKFGAQETPFFDGVPDLDNLALYSILTHENSYLAGVAAGMLTRTKKVGAVGGGDFPGINLFIVGFEEGVKSICADCETVRGYVGGETPFSDPVRAKELSLGLFADGADILFQVAGRSGEGVLEAAKDTGNFAIGVDSNQDDLYPGTVIVSAMKRVDNAVFNFVQSVVDGTFAPGETTVGLKEGFAGLSWDVGVCSRTFDENGPADMVEKLPAVRQAIDEARQKILDGDITVTNALEAASS